MSACVSACVCARVCVGAGGNVCVGVACVGAASVRACARGFVPAYRACGREGLCGRACVALRCMRGWVRCMRGRCVGSCPRTVRAGGRAVLCGWARWACACAGVGGCILHGLLVA